MGESTPKRKRSQQQQPPREESPSKESRSTGKINTLLLPSDLQTLDSQNSPRTKVAYHFQGLQLSSPISKLELSYSPDPNATSPLSPSSEIRKRVKVLEGSADSNEIESEIPETPQVTPTFKINIGPERAVDPFIQEKADALTLRNAIDPVIFSAQRHFTSKRRGNITNKKRNGTPPLFSASKPKPYTVPSTKVVMSPNTSFSSTSSSTSEIFLADPDTADDDDTPTSLTWLDSEITGHNLSDPEDDGEGINGIGFKPTAAQAYQRMEKRRQQMAEYRIRETREARAKRGARRRGSGSDAGVSGGEKETRRKVRFVVGEGDGVNAV